MKDPNSRRRKYSLSSKKLAYPSKICPEAYGCIFIDISWLDMAYAMSYVGSLRKHRVVQDELENLLGGTDKILVSLSVRSAFDLFLQAMHFPKGSEIVCTNINIASMKDIAKYHGLILKAIDLDLASIKPSLTDIEEAITENTVAIMVVQLFGRRFRTSEVLTIARKHNIILLEDCAQGYCGPHCVTETEADVTFFSFGSIKRTTCFGGAITVSKNQGLLLKMRTIQDRYECQSRFVYLRKLIKYVLVILITNHPFISWISSRLWCLLGVDYERLVKSFLRGFPRNLMQMIRFQPSIPLLLLMKRRLSQKMPNEKTNQLGLINAEFFIVRLLEKPVYVVGCLSELRDFWLFPVLVDNPNEVENELEKLGVSAFSKASSLVLVEEEDPSGKLKSSFFLLKHLIFLPIDKRCPKHHLDHVYESMEHVLEQRESIFEIADREGVILRRDYNTLVNSTVPDKFPSFS